MSKNFELVSRVEGEPEIFGELAIERDFLSAKLPCVCPQILIDKAVRQEEENLIERVFLIPGENAPRVVAFLGVESPCGAAGICARAGQNLTEKTGLPVCLVDADLCAPALYDYFDMNSRRFDLAVASAQGGAVRDHTRGSDRTNLFLISAGHAVAGPPPSWKSGMWLSRLNELRREFQYILIAGPSAARQGDAILLALCTDGVILILESQVTRRETARALKQSLDAAKVAILGAVLNNRSFPIPKSIYTKL
jgi:Mrp family chromosome partitioning ATPase